MEATGMVLRQEVAKSSKVVDIEVRNHSNGGPRKCLRGLSQQHIHRNPQLGPRGRPCYYAD